MSKSDKLAPTSSYRDIHSRSIALERSSICLLEKPWTGRNLAGTAFVKTHSHFMWCLPPQGVHDALCSLRITYKDDEMRGFRAPIFQTHRLLSMYM